MKEKVKTKKIAEEKNEEKEEEGLKLTVKTKVN